MKLILLRRKILTLAVCLLCAAAMFYAVNPPAVTGTGSTTRQLPIYCVQRDQKVADYAACTDSFRFEPSSFRLWNSVPYNNCHLY